MNQELRALAESYLNFAKLAYSWFRVLRTQQTRFQIENYRLPSGLVLTFYLDTVSSRFTVARNDRSKLFSLVLEDPNSYSDFQEFCS